MHFMKSNKKNVCPVRASCRAARMSDAEPDAEPDDEPDEPDEPRPARPPRPRPARPPAEQNPISRKRRKREQLRDRERDAKRVRLSGTY